MRGALVALRGFDPERAWAWRRAASGVSDHGPPLPMAPPGQDSGATREAAAAALETQKPCVTCTTCDREEATHHERKLSAASTSTSTFSSSPTASSSSTNYLPASNTLSCDSIPYDGPDLVKLSSLSSTSSYESFFHIEASDPDLLGTASGSEFLDFEPTTRPPAVQTMMAEGQHKAEAPAYDPKRLPSSMFRTRSTSPAEWSTTSNESLFSIQLSNSAGELNALYANFYYDAARFPRFPSVGREAALNLKLPSLSESPARSGGGLCVRHDCARCGDGSSKTRKSVRFAAAESITGEGKHSVVVSTLEVAVEETEATAATATATATKGREAGWCELGCCMGLPSSPTWWWPSCCGCQGCGCHCKWWF